jgi:hypothetical protein
MWFTIPFTIADEELKQLEEQHFSELNKVRSSDFERKDLLEHIIVQSNLTDGEMEMEEDEEEGMSNISMVEDQIEINVGYMDHEGDNAFIEEEEEEEYIVESEYIGEEEEEQEYL